MTEGLELLAVGVPDVSEMLDSDLSVRVTCVDDLASAEIDGEFDCILVGESGADGVCEGVERAREAFPSVPCIAVVADGDTGAAAVEAGATDAAPTDAPTLLSRRVRNAAVRSNFRTTESADAEAKIRALHDVATRLETCEDEAEIFEVAVEAAENILEFDICYVGTVEDGEIRPQAANAAPLLDDPVIMTVEEGLAGRTVRRGETYVVDDAQEDPDADPVDDTYRSALSVPLGDFGIFQAVATEYAAFDGTDRELGELLAAHVVAAVDRVRYAAALERERDRFAALFENVPDAAVRYVVRDGDPVVESVNPAFESIFGIDADAAVGRSLVDLVVPDDLRAEAYDHVDAMAAGETLASEVVRQTKTGRQEFLMRTARVRSGDETTGYVIYTDVSDLKQRERALQRQNARLQQFASIVSHDLRNPLNVATGRLEVALEDLEAGGDVEEGWDPGEGRDHVDVALESLARMERLIDDLLALARQGQVVSDPEPVDLDEVARAAWSGVATEGARFEDAGLPTLDADPGRVQQLFENLFRNAVEHGSTSPGSQTRQDAVEHGGPDVTVTAGTLGDGAVPGGFYVADDGPGVPEAEREKVLDHGYTSGDGTGLGLAIVAQIAEAHGWDVTVTESGDGGARFEFRLDD